MSRNAWPALPYDAWKDTYVTLHMWTQMAGKVALARAAPLNHSWAIAFLFTPRGLRTRLLSHGSRTFTLTFDFLDHQLVIETSDNLRRALPLAPRSVANFYRELMGALDDMGLPVRIWSMPVELASPVRFEEDTEHQSYEREFVERWWHILGQVHQVFTECDARSSESAVRSISSGAPSIWPSADFPGALHRRGKGPPS